MLTREELIKKWESLTLADDFIFCKVMQNEDVCKPMLEFMLDIKISKLVYHESQKSIDLVYDAKGIRLDVYVADSERVFDVEMQTTIKPNMPKRARYYQSLIDIDTLKTGEIYTKLKECFIIFICTTDPFGEKLSRYTFKTRCEEKDSLYLDDKITKVFYNVEEYEKEQNSEVKAFLELIKNNKPSTSFTKHLRQLVDEAKNQNEKWRCEYMTLEMIKTEERYMGREEGIQQGIQQGLQQGAYQTKLETARNLKYANIDTSLIASCTGLSLEEIEKL